MNNKREKQLFYIAGLIDGEGSIGISKTVHSGMLDGFQLKPFLLITNTDAALLEYAQKIIGGYIHFYKLDNEKWRDKGTLQINEKKLLEKVILEIVDKLVLKKEQAKLMLEFLSKYSKKCRGRGNSRPYTKEEVALTESMRFLNRRGPR